MSTTLLACEQELSKQIGDSWNSTSTADGSTTPFITLIDTALKAKANDWITDDTWVFLTEEPSGGSTSLYEERLVSSLNNSSGALTFLAFAERIVSGIDYEVHRLFSPTEKRIALIYAARHIFPHCYDQIWDEQMVSKNWLKDGSFEVWTGTTALDYWTTSVSTLTRTSTAYFFKHGAYSCKLATAAGNISQSVSNWDDLKRLAGKTVTFTVQGWCDTASCLRISINDGVNDETFSSYHDGDSAWTEDNDPLTVTQTIDDNPTQITFKIYHVLEAATTETTYVDDARVISSEPDSPRLYIGHIGFTKNLPYQVFVESEDYSLQEPWQLIPNAVIDTEGGHLYLPSSVARNRRLRIRGYGVLDFLAAGVSSTTWAATINLDQPQLDILIAQAALYLYQEMAMPNFSIGTRRTYQEMIPYWEEQLRKRIGRFAMEPLSAPVKWK